MKNALPLLCLLSLFAALPVSAKTKDAAPADAKPDTKKANPDDPDQDPMVVSVKAAIKETDKALKTAQEKHEPADKIKELTTKLEALKKDLSQARKTAREAIATRKAEEQKSKRGGKK